MSSADITVRATYWTRAGRFRRRKVKITGEFPNHLLNGADRQAHSLSENPIYLQSTDPFYLKVPAKKLEHGWLSLVGNTHLDPGLLSMMIGPLVAPVPVPPPPTKGEGLGVLIEEGAVHPVSCVPFTDDIARQKEQASTHAEALQLARVREAKSIGGDGLHKMAYVVAMVAAVALVAVIVIVSIQARFGGDDTETAAVMEGLPTWL